MRKIVIEEMKCELHTFIVPDDYELDASELLAYGHQAEANYNDNVGIDTGKHYIHYTLEPGVYDINVLGDDPYENEIKV